MLGEGRSRPALRARRLVRSYRRWTAVEQHIDVADGSTARGHAWEQARDGIASCASTAMTSPDRRLRRRTQSGVDNLIDTRSTQWRARAREVARARGENVVVELGTPAGHAAARGRSRVEEFTPQGRRQSTAGLESHDALSWSAGRTYTIDSEQVNRPHRSAFPSDRSPTVPERLPTRLKICAVVPHIRRAARDRGFPRPRRPPRRTGGLAANHRRRRTLLIFRRGATAG